MKNLIVLLGVTLLIIGCTSDITESFSDENLSKSEVQKYSNNQADELILQGQNILKDPLCRQSCCGDIAEFVPSVHPSNGGHVFGFTKLRVPCIDGAQKYRWQITFPNHPHLLPFYICFDGGACSDEYIDISSPTFINMRWKDEQGQNHYVAPFDTSCEYEFQYICQYSLEENSNCQFGQWVSCMASLNSGIVPGFPMGSPGIVSCN